jgi:hypothetical protein
MTPRSESSEKFRKAAIRVCKPDVKLTGGKRDF